jgi:hypothetical protein
MGAHLVAWIACFSLLGSIGSVAGAGLMLLFPASAIRRVILPCLVSYATVARSRPRTRSRAALLFVGQRSCDRAAGNRALRP